MPGRQHEPVVEQVYHLLWTSFEDGAVVFDQRTGDTHALDSVHASALRDFLSGAPDGDASTAACAASPALAHLRRVGLV